MAGRALHTLPHLHTSSPGCTWPLASPAPPSYTHVSNQPENTSLSGNYKTKRRNSSSVRFQAGLSGASLVPSKCLLLPHPMEMICSLAELPMGHTLDLDGAMSFHLCVQCLVHRWHMLNNSNSFSMYEMLSLHLHSTYYLIESFQQPHPTG